MYDNWLRQIVRCVDVEFAWEDLTSEYEVLNVLDGKLVLDNLKKVDARRYKLVDNDAEYEEMLLGEN